MIHDFPRTPKDEMHARACQEADVRRLTVSVCHIRACDVSEVTGHLLLVLELTPAQWAALRGAVEADDRRRTPPGDLWPPLL